MTTAGGKTLDRVVLAMVAFRIGLAAQWILWALVLGSSIGLGWWLLFTGLALAYAACAWRYPAADLPWRRALSILAFVDIGLTIYQAWFFFDQRRIDDTRYFWYDVLLILLQLIPAMVVAALVGKNLANLRTSRSDATAGSFALPNGTIIELGVDEDY